jgi:hypothetical protein
MRAGVTVHVVDLALVAEAFDARRSAWAADGATSAVRGPGGHASKPAVSVRLETAEGMAEFVVWDSGEAELIHVDLPDGEPLVEVCEVTSVHGVNARLDDMEGYVGLRR